ncbi:SKP1-like protein 9 [Morus notabilis]|uniref:SKP1-like protein 9 n=2 Tax=Morus notabilis TaxID=981085 RepID=W9S302_9ROSA|nr:SKP1-like protein 9 [Morus notabilis]
MLKAANYLDCARLTDLLIKKVAAAMKDKTVEQLYQFWGVESDFTPEEEEENHRRYGWIYD